MLNAVGELLTHRTHNTTAPRDHHRDAEYMIRDLVAFYGGQMLIVESEKKSKCQGGILVSRNVNPRQQGLAAQSCSDLISQDQRTTSSRLALFGPGTACNGCGVVSGFSLAMVFLRHGQV